MFQRLEKRAVVAGGSELPPPLSGRLSETSKEGRWREENRRPSVWLRLQLSYAHIVQGTWPARNTAKMRNLARQRPLLGHYRQLRFSKKIVFQSGGILENFAARKAPFSLAHEGLSIGTELK
jgi:hypothetical protein